MKRADAVIIAAFVAVATIPGVPAVFNAVEARRQHACHENMQRIGRALLQYAADWDNRVPPVARYPEGGGHVTWMDACCVNGLRCPAASKAAECTYGLNASYLLSIRDGKSVTNVDIAVDDATQTVMVTDGLLTVNSPANRRWGTGPLPMHPEESANVLWVDGHANRKRASALTDTYFDRR